MEQSEHIFPLCMYYFLFLHFFWWSTLEDRLEIQSSWIWQYIRERCRQQIEFACAIICSKKHNNTASEDKAINVFKKCQWTMLWEQFKFCLRYLTQWNTSLGCKMHIVSYSQWNHTGNVVPDTHFSWLQIGKRINILIYSLFLLVCISFIWSISVWTPSFVGETVYRVVLNILHRHY